MKKYFGTKDLGKILHLPLENSLKTSSLSSERIGKIDPSDDLSGFTQAVPTLTISTIDGHWWRIPATIRHAAALPSSFAVTARIGRVVGRIVLPIPYTIHMYGRGGCPSAYNLSARNAR